MIPQISIIIPVFNAIHHTKKCLQELHKSLSSESLSTYFTIIVVDDGSTDGTSDWIKSNYPQTIVLEGNGNLWWSGGINMGTRYALKELNSDYILWWNNDVLASPDYFKKILWLVENNTIHILGSKIYYSNSTIVWSMGGIFDTRSGSKYMIGMNEADSPSFEKEFRVDWLPGMGTLIHKEVFEKIGLVDEINFPQYHGDSDFTYRATLAGYEITVYPDLKLWNDKSNSGLLHNNSFKQLLRTLNDNKSNYHFGKDLTFYKRYATSVIAYKTLAHKYCYYVGGFLKWKILNTIGLSKKESVQ